MPKLKPLHPLPVVYISGPMSGLDDFNFPTFNENARLLRMLGFPTLNPADFGASPNETWEECLARDLLVLRHADVVLLLPGWEESKGATLEVKAAHYWGKAVVPPDDWEEFLDCFFDPDELDARIEDDEARRSSPLVILRVVDKDGDAGSTARLDEPESPEPPATTTAEGFDAVAFDAVTTDIEPAGWYDRFVDSLKPEPYSFNLDRN